MTIDTTTAASGPDAGAASHCEDPDARRAALTAASAVARACAWGLSPAVEDLRRADLHSEADTLSMCARDLDTLAATLSPENSE